MTNDRGFIGRTLDAMGDNILATIIAALVIGGVGTWTYNMFDSYNKAQVERVRIEKGLELRTGDYNGNGLIDKFYEINGQKVPVEVDGKPVAEYFKK